MTKREKHQFQTFILFLSKQEMYLVEPWAAVFILGWNKLLSYFHSDHWLECNQATPTRVPAKYINIYCLSLLSQAAW